jgi:hypothetical protein
MKPPLCSYCRKPLEAMRRGGSSKTDTCADCFWKHFEPRKTINLPVMRPLRWRNSYRSVPNPATELERNGTKC